MKLRIGIDVGGTFTDLVLLDEESGRLVQHKTPSTPDDPSRGVVAGLQELGIGLDEVGLIVHGTTVTTNAVLTEGGAKTGLLTTEGFRDVLEMRRGVRSRRHLYDNKYVAPPPLVPRYLRLRCRSASTSGARCGHRSTRPLFATRSRSSGATASRPSPSASCTPTPSRPTSAARPSSSRSSRRRSSSPSRRRSCRRSGSTSVRAPR